MKNNLKLILKYSLIFLLLIGIYANNFAQKDNKIDSLIQATSNLEDSKEKVDNLIRIAKEYRYNDMEQALIYSTNAEKLATKIDYKDGQLKALYEKARIFRLTKSLDSAKIYISNCVDLAKAYNDKKRLAISLYEYGIISSKLGETDTAVVYFKLAFQESKTLGLTRFFIPIFNELGNIYQKMACYDSAIIYYHKSLSLSEESGNSGIGTVLNNLGKTYYLKEEEKPEHGYDFEEAKKYLYKSLEYRQTNSNPISEAVVYTNLGNIANEENALEPALILYEKAKQIYLKYNNQKGLSDLLINEGEIYRKQGNLEKAMQYFDMALDFYKEKEITHGIIIAMKNKAIVLMEQGKTTDAIALYDTCLNLSEKTRDTKNKLEIYKYLYQLYKENGDFEKAFNFQSKYVILKDNIYTIDKERVINNLQLKYEKQKDQAKILEQKLDLKKRTNQRNIYLFSGIGSIIVLLLLFAYHKNASRKNKIIAEQKIQQLEEEKKLLAAKFLVEGEEKERKRIAKELHDGLGVLLSATKMQFMAIKDKSPENKPLIEKARKLLEQATSDVRKISHNMMPGLLTKFGFYEAVEDLFEKLDDVEGLTAAAEILGDKKRLPENTEIMLYRIVQEMANNTLKHAQATETSIQIVVLPEQLSIDYSDNGKGFDIDKMVAEKSIGLTSIQSRVKFLNGDIDMRSKIGHGVNFHISILLKV